MFHSKKSSLVTPTSVDQCPMQTSHCSSAAVKRHIILHSYIGNNLRDEIFTVFDRRDPIDAWRSVVDAINAIVLYGNAASSSPRTSKS